MRYAGNRLRLVFSLLLLLASLGATTGCADDDPAQLWVTQETIDFGRVLHGDVVNRSVVLRNGGDREVYVTNTVFNCTCFQIRPFNRMLKPGEERELEITFLSGLVRPERIRGKKLDIVSNDAIAPRLQVALEGDPVRAFTVIPPQIDFGARKPGKAVRPRIVQVRPGPGLDLEVVDWRVQPPGVVAVKRTEVDGGADFVLTVDESEGREGPIRAALILRLRIEGSEFDERMLDYRVDIAGE